MRPLQKNKLIHMYQKMQEIRRFEEKLYYLFLTGTMPGTIHECVGQEAIPVGVCENLKKTDYITTTHRGHGHCIAKGMPLKEMMAELFAKKTGCCKGMSGSLHLAKISLGILGTGGIVGAGIPIAAGAALSVKLRGTKQVVVCFFGEGASNTGAFHEGINLAAVWRLPVVFVCENNLYGFSTSASKVMLVKNVNERANAYGIPGLSIDGNDVLAVYESAQKALRRAREGEGPTLIECKTYRHKGHARFDPAEYRPKEELKQWLKRDPIAKFRDELIKMDVLSGEDLESIEQKIDIEIQGAIRFAEKSPDPDPDAALKYVYA